MSQSHSVLASTLAETINEEVQKEVGAAKDAAKNAADAAKNAADAAKTAGKNALAKCGTLDGYKHVALINNVCYYCSGDSGINWGEQCICIADNTVCKEQPLP